LEGRSYSRKYLRIGPEEPLYGTAGIVRVGARTVCTGSARVRILDISPGGLRFVSSLKLPADRQLILEIRFQLEGTNYCLQGYVTHYISSEVCEFEYGFCFSEPAAELRETLKKLFGRMLILSGRHIVILRMK
jgi:hypothetical protein